MKAKQPEMVIVEEPEVVLERKTPDLSWVTGCVSYLVIQRKLPTIGDLQPWQIVKEDHRGKPISFFLSEVDAEIILKHLAIDEYHDYRIVRGWLPAMTEVIGEVTNKQFKWLPKPELTK